MALPENPRSLLRLSGADAAQFLQNLVTNDVGRSGLCYAALLTPQGKYLADFFIFQDDGAIVLDVAKSAAQPLAARLSMYRLRADVQIDLQDAQVNCGIGPAPQGAWADPRHAEMGWRHYGVAVNGQHDWAALRVKYAIPETGVELTPETYVLEAGFERLNGVDFKKGCYVGQEVTARMKHKTELRKGLAQVEIDGEVPVGSPITADGKPVGQVFTQSGSLAIAHLRFDRAGQDMKCEGVGVRYFAQG